jgi:sugar-specific transcriptional regulator TrmB
MNQGLLSEIGFTGGEVRVYFALLESGTTTSGPIITASKVARSKVYDILEKLKEKGLVSEIIKDNTRYFQALSPNRILNYLDSKENKIKEQKDSFKKVLPYLLEKQKIKQSEHQIRVYHDFEGIKTLYVEMMTELKKEDEYLGFAFSAEAFKHKPILILLDRFHNLRAQKGARAKILCKENDVVNAQKLKSKKIRYYEYRISTHPFPPSVSIFKDIVATFIWSEVPRVFVIKSKDNADHYRKFFLDLWKKSRSP